MLHIILLLLSFPASLIFVASFLYHIFVKFYIMWCTCHRCLVGKTILITGANAGIGYEVALDFAKRGGRVILACRNEERGEIARKKIIAESDNDNIILKLIDMRSFESVRSFAKDINATERRLDILVNNAGAVGIGDRKSCDGHQLLMQVNYYSSFLLTSLLLGLLKRTERSRIINVASIAAHYANLDLERLNHFPGILTLYGNTKLCNVLFTQELAKRLSGTGVTTYSLHPGGVKTEILRRARGFDRIFAYIINLFYISAPAGAQTVIYCALTKGIEEFSGENFYNCQKVKPYKTVKSGMPRKLWERTEELLGFNFE